MARYLPPRARRDGKPRLASVGRGPDRTVDGRRQPGQMASRPCHLVLRAIPAGAERSRLQDLRPALSLPVQLLLCRRRPAPRAPATRPDHAAEQRRCRRLSRPCRCGGRAADRRRAGGGRRARLLDSGDRPASRAAAPGIADHRYPARLRAESTDPVCDLRDFTMPEASAYGTNWANTLIVWRPGGATDGSYAVWK